MPQLKDETLVKLRRWTPKYKLESFPVNRGVDREVLSLAQGQVPVKDGNLEVHLACSLHKDAAFNAVTTYQLIHIVKQELPCFPEPPKRDRSLRGGDREQRRRAQRGKGHTYEIRYRAGGRKGKGRSTATAGRPVR